MNEKEISIANRNRLLGTKVIKSLQARRFDAHYCETAAEAAEKALSFLTAGSSVSWGGSATLLEIGLLETIAEGDFEVIDRDKAADGTERMELMRRALLVDTYLTSFNALSEDGILVNVDNLGNRTAAITFGPKQIVAVVGMNKVCKTAEDARQRARTYAAPINVQRCAFDPFLPPIKTAPCATTGSCADCTSSDCLCSTIVETRMCKVPGRIKIILVGEPLGI